MRRYKIEICTLICVLIIGILSISSHGLWVDEAVRIQSANYRCSEGFWYHQYDHLQLGLCHLQYLWGTLWGKTEIAYRSINILFLVVASAYMVLLLRKHGLSPLWAIVFCAHPICVYYTNDASPYIMLLACSNAVYYHAFFSERQETWSNSALLLGWLLFGFYLHFIYGFVGVLYICSLIWRMCRNKSFSSLRKQIVLALIFAPFFLFLAYSYMQYMGHGASRGWDTPGVFNAGVAAYCFFGLGGLGLPRNDMRMGDFHLVTPYMLSCVMMMLAALIIIISAGFKKFIACLKEPYVISAIVLFMVFYIAAFSRNFQFWERHLIFLFPPFFLILAVTCRDAWTKSPRWLYRSLIIICGSLLLLSSAQLRWKYIYQKDDLKGAILHLKTTGYIGSDIPILAQGSNSLYRYYTCENYDGDIPETTPPNIRFVNNVSASKIVSAVEELIPSHQELVLILTQKDVNEKSFYKEADLVFERKGYAVVSNTDYNTVKILFLKNKHNLAL